MAALVLQKAGSGRQPYGQHGRARGLRRLAGSRSSLSRQASHHGDQLVDLFEGVVEG